MDNYWEIFGELPTDILDEIRLAILDDIDISKYIISCGKDDYRLKQIRIALREGVNPKYLTVDMSAECIKLIRFFNLNVIDLGMIDRYISGNKLTIDSKYMIYILTTIKQGINISSIDFEVFRSDLIPVICAGLIKGYPMEVFEGYDNLTEDYIRLLMRGMNLDIDIMPFLNQTWDYDKLNLLFNYSRRVDINEFVSMITTNFSIDVLKVLLDYKSTGGSIERLCYHDEDGYCIYNEFQLQAIIDGIKVGYVGDDLYNPSLSDLEMRRLYETEV